MTQQLRSNAGKPVLSYLFASSNALQKCIDYYVDGLPGRDDAMCDAFCAVQDIAHYLARGSDGDSALVTALQYTLAALEADLHEPMARTHDFLQTLLAAVHAVDEVSAVYVFGEIKYARGNFRKGAPITQYLDSALRHLRKFLNGERRDEESGKHHLAHTFWNLWQALDQPAFRDDRLPAVYQGDTSFDFGFAGHVSNIPFEEEEVDTDERPCVPPPALIDVAPPPRDSDSPLTKCFNPDCYCQNDPKYRSVGGF